MKNEEIEQFVLEIDIPKSFPVLVSSMGLTKRQYSKLINKGENWFYSRENDGKKFNLNDLRRLELFFKDMFPKQNFNLFVYNTLRNNKTYFSKQKLLKEIEKLKGGEND